MALIQTCIAVLALFAATATAQKSAVLGIDLGSQFFKVAVVKTGGFDVVLNEASKRKTATAMAVINDERSFGDNAVSQKPRYPKKVVAGFLHLIGKAFDAKPHEQGEFGGYHLPYTFKKDEKRGTVIMDVDGTEWSPDEVLGMIFYHIKDMTQKYIEGTVSECVVTVPPYLTEHERRHIIDAAAMVDLTVIMLVNDNTAVAVRYGIERKTQEKNNVLFVDVGSSHTTATVASYFTRNITEYKQVSSLQIVSTAWASVGGSAMDATLVNHFADVFDEQHKKKVRENPKAISKLRKDTEKIKTVLSANKETMLVIEGLMDDVDFKTKINREQFETMCAKIWADIEVPIKEAIVKSGLPLAEIHEVIPFGAGTRVPKIKDMVLKITEREKWQPSINTDEAGALGAAFVAANFSKSFRLREFHVYDYFPYSIGIDMNGKKATIFKQGSVMEAKKTITQPLSDEAKEADLLNVAIAYDKPELLPTGTPTGLASYTITGMKEAMGKYNVTGTPKVSIAVGLHRDAIADVLHAELKVHSMDWVKRQRFVKKNVTEEVKVKVNTTNGTNGTNSSNDTRRDGEATEEKTEEKKEEKKEESASSWSLFGSPSPPAEEAKEANASNTTDPMAGFVMQNVTREKTVEVMEEKLEKKLHTVVLNLTRTHAGVITMDDDTFKAAQKRHETMVAAELERVARANAKNDVEATIFAAREKLTQDGMDTVSTEEAREEISSKLTAAEDWLWEDGDNVEVKVYEEKKAELKKLSEDIFYRFDQVALRESAMKYFKETVEDAKKRVEDWDAREAKRIEKNETTWIHANETKRVLKMVNESETWLTEKEAELKTAGLMVKPPFSASEVVQYVKPLANEVSYLRYKPKPKSKKKKKKKATNGTNVTNATNATEEVNATKAEAEEETKEKSGEEKPKEETPKEKTEEEKPAEEPKPPKDMPTDEL